MGASAAWRAARATATRGLRGRHVADLLAQIDHWGERGRRRPSCASSPWCTTRSSTGQRLAAARPARTTTRCAPAASPSATPTTSACSPRSSSTTAPTTCGAGSAAPGAAGRRTLDRRCSTAIPDLELFVRFVELDGSTEGKNPSRSRWFGERARRGAADRARAGRSRRPGRAARRATGAPLRARRRGARRRDARRSPRQCGRLARRLGRRRAGARCRSAAVHQPPGRGGRDRHRAGRPARDGAADRSAPARVAGASQPRCLARSVDGGARGAGRGGHAQAVLAERRELDDEVERRADLLSEPGNMRS